MRKILGVLAVAVVGILLAGCAMPAHARPRVAVGNEATARDGQMSSSFGIDFGEYDAGGAPENVTLNTTGVRIPGYVWIVVATIGLLLAIRVGTMIVRDRAAARAKGIALLPVLLVLAVGGALASAAADDCPSGRCPIPLGPAAPATEQPVDVGVLRRGRAAAVVQPAPASRCGRRVYQRPSWVRCDTAPDPTWCRWQMPRVPRNRRPCEFPIECVR